MKKQFLKSSVIFFQNLIKLYIMGDTQEAI